MDSDQLSRLLLEQEGPTVEFKREWYRIDAEAQDVKRTQRDELIKDILALANGSIATAGETAFLVVGAGDDVGDTGRELYDVEDFPSDIGKRVLQLVSSACSPALANITSQLVVVGEHALGVLTIHPTPHLHETTRVLKTPSGAYSEHVVFIRSGDAIQLASATERNALLRRKEKRFKEYRRVSPVSFGAGMGATVGGLAALAYASQQYSASASRLAAMLSGSVVFGFIGWVAGMSYRQVSDVFRVWHRIPLPGRLLVWAILLGVVVWVGSVVVSQVLG